MDPKAFYDQAMPAKLGTDYEAARWKAGPLLAAQYAMLADVMHRVVLPRAVDAARILEVGPGPGTWTKFLLGGNPNASYTLVDISNQMLSQAKAALRAHKNITFVERDLVQFTSDTPFDFFFSSRAIEYMPDKDAACRRIAALLTRGSEGVIITKMPKYYFDRMRGRAVSTLHQGQIAPRELVAHLSHAGLLVTSVRLATATVPGVGNPSLNRFAFALMKRLPLVAPLSLFAESYVISFSKPV